MCENQTARGKEPWVVPRARASVAFLAESNLLAVILRVPRVESRSVSSMQEGTYFVYVMSSLSRTLYTGVTNDLERRVAEHKEGKPGSFTGRYNLTRLVYFERFDYIRDAIARENGIKRMVRARKIALVDSMNPQWQHFTEHCKTAGKEPPFSTQP